MMKYEFGKIWNIIDMGFFQNMIIVYLPLFVFFTISQRKFIVFFIILANLFNSFPWSFLCLYYFKWCFYE